MNKQKLGTLLFYGLLAIGIGVILLAPTIKAQVCTVTGVTESIKRGRIVPFANVRRINLNDPSDFSDTVSDENGLFSFPIVFIGSPHIIAVNDPRYTADPVMTDCFDTLSPEVVLILSTRKTHITTRNP